MSGLFVKAGKLLVKGLGLAPRCDCCAGDGGRGACCGVANDLECDVLTKKECEAAGGWWFQGEGVPCVSVGCPGPALSVAVTITGAKVNPDFRYPDQVAGPVARINQTFTLPVPCQAGRPQCPAAGAWGPQEIGRLLSTMLIQTGDGGAFGYDVCFSCYARANCTVHMARVGICLVQFPPAALSAPPAPAAPQPAAVSTRLMDGNQHAEWLLGYTEDPDTGLENTPMGPCPKAGDTIGGAPSFVGVNTGGRNVAPWDLTGCGLSIRYV